MEEYTMYKYIKSDYEATIPQEMLYAPDGGENSIRDYFRQRGAEDKKAKEEAARRAERQAEIDAFKEKYPEEELTAIRESAESSQLEELFELTVPRSGMADTVGGEIVRAVMRILYRDYNDGDVFYEGYGKETCLPSVSYLCDVFPWAYDRFDSIANQELHEEMYTDAITKISEEICWELLYDNIELFWTPNDVDSRMFDDSAYRFYEPEYEYEGDFPENLIEAMYDRKVSRDDVEQELEWSLDGEGIKYEDYSVGEYGYTVYGLDADSYERLQEIGSGIGDSIADDLVPEPQDEDDYDEEW